VPTVRAFYPWHLSSNTCRSASGLILVLALISGLLNFPSTCQCGAELPHPHSLFLLADHHHSPDGETESSEHDHPEHANGSPLQAEFAEPGPIVQGAVPEGVAGDQIGLVLSGATLQAWTGELASAGWRLKLPIPTIGEPPDLPPPRV
jgi:hypothetical protein